MEFLRVGLHGITLNTTCNFQNAEVHYNFNEAVVGEYQKFTIDYPKVVLTKGKMEMLTEVGLLSTPRGIEINWDAEFTGQGTKTTDQVMLLLYFPKLQKAVYETAGAKRSRGEEELAIGPIFRKHTFHAYISFLSEDRKGISNNHYMVEFKWIIKKHCDKCNCNS